MSQDSDSDSDCSRQVTIRSPEDAAALDCRTLTGDIIIPTDATGDLVIESLVQLEGRILNVQCRPDPSDCPSQDVTSLSLPNLEIISDYSLLDSDDRLEFHLANMPALRTIDLPHLYNTGSFKLVNLPSLETVSIGNQGTYESVILENLPSLLSVDFAAEADEAYIFGELHISDVGLYNLSFFEKISGAYEAFTIDGIPNVDEANIYSISATWGSTWSFSGNGNVTVTVGMTKEWLEKNDYDKEVDGLWPNVTFSGLGNLAKADCSRNMTVLEGESLHLTDNNFAELDLFWNEMGSLYIENNPKLEKLVFPDYPYPEGCVDDCINEYCDPYGTLEWTYNTSLPSDWKMEELVIRGNPLLNLSHSSWTTRAEGMDVTKEWIWRNGTMRTLILDGMVYNSFFDPLKAHYLADSSSSCWDCDPSVGFHVTDLVEVRSTVQGFDCGPVQELRELDVFQGEFTCEVVVANSDGGGDGSGDGDSDDVGEDDDNDDDGSEGGGDRDSAGIRLDFGGALVGLTFVSLIFVRL
ncbi:hypothetical protein MKZ38_003558 [Zalerion maritima]|uniref:Uncharacterized protein n=1 Tax=Zalerion maritima TaxID=339359 RepID=A0AAD5RMP8_9PEZI|nr:hypothetical protein MKZ38_003558 [Zalerion maritima]